MAMKPRFDSLEKWLAWQETLHWTEIEMGLDRLRNVARRMQLLVLPFPVITVAGTNGKGSTVAMLEAILLAEGYSTGAFTSPHLEHYNERIKIAGSEVDDTLICDAFHAIDSARGFTSLTYFEFATLAAIWIFKQQRVQLAILEVGLGGRLDAVNLWDSDVAVITNIGIDHVQWLGDNRADIGREKSGIMRSQRPVISGDLDPPKSIQVQADQVKATLHQAGKHFTWKIRDKNWDLYQHQPYAEQKWMDLPVPSLMGDFQFNNAAVAITALSALDCRLNITISEASIQTGLKNVSLKGRIEKLQSRPEIILDAAHNTHAARQLAQWSAANPPAGKTYALFSMLEDKDIAKVVEVMSQVVDSWFVSGINDPRGLTVEKVVEKMLEQHSAGKKVERKKEKLQQQEQDNNSRLKVTSFETLELAWQACKMQATSTDRIIVFGSFLILSRFKVIF